MHFRTVLSLIGLNLVYYTLFWKVGEIVYLKCTKTPNVQIYLIVSGIMLLIAYSLVKVGVVKMVPWIN